MNFRSTFPTLAAAFLALMPAAGCQAASSAARSGIGGGPELAVTQRLVHLDALAREPMVVQHPNGTLFMAGYGGVSPSPPEPGATQRPRRLEAWYSRLWKSRDGGATWSQVDPGPGGRDVIGNSDVDLAVAPDGTLYFITMLYDRDAGEGRRITMGVTRDGGATWSWTVLSQRRFDDRPWVEVARDGTVHAIWNDGEGVNHVVSRDRGATWSKPVHISSRGGSSHLAVGPGAEVAVRVTPASASGNKLDPGVDLILVSTDGGRTWREVTAPGTREWVRPGPDAAFPRWVEPLAWDGQGRLYSLWTDTAGVWLARSSDRGTTWTSWAILPCHAPCYFPYLIARGAGDLAATWFSGKGAALRWQAARIQVGRGMAAPRTIPSPLLELEALAPDSTGAYVRADTGGEYVGITFLRDGGLGAITPVQNPPRRLGFTWWRLEVRQ